MTSPRPPRCLRHSYATCCTTSLDILTAYFLNLSSQSRDEHLATLALILHLFHGLVLFPQSHDCVNQPLDSCFYTFVVQRIRRRNVPRVVHDPLELERLHDLEGL